MPKTNREFKDSLFKDYFADEERLIEAYNAIAGTDYPLTARVEFKELKKVLFQSASNDIAFLLEDRFIVLIEHQSTINENMPLRMLQYYSEISKGLVAEDALYGKKAAKIPTPEFFVIYNGLDDYPDKKVLRLSDAFIGPPAKRPQPKPPNLELIVTVHNIATGHSEKMLQRSAALSDYARFVSVAYECLKDAKTEEENEEAIKKTVQYCLKRGIMVSYLKKKGSEVGRMLSLEWNDEVYRRVLLKEGREEGRAQGHAQGRLEVARNMKAEGAEAAFIAKVTGLSEDDIAAL
ncbi:MAG: Rpn family recombination-promoting nuclease/putative transposase [Clostridiales bacterium]|nr:Rpn family recombination-promoting nuclease/putative transposase [Clostridiales bacterium]